MKTKNKPRVSATTDFKILNGGSVYLFCPKGEAAKAWLAEHCPEGESHQYLGPNLCVEHRFAQDLATHAINDDLTVS